MRAFLSFLSKTVNAYLDLDPASQSRLQILEGKVIGFELLSLHFKFQCVFINNHMDIVTDQIAETTIRGTPLAFLATAFAKQQRQRFFAEDLTIEGSAELAAEVIALFDELTIDWQEYTSHFIGDIPTYHVERAFKKTNQWLAQIKSSLTQNIDEYIHEEKEWLPSNEALQDLFNDIDQLRMDVDRIEATINYVLNEDEV